MTADSSSDIGAETVGTTRPAGEGLSDEEAVAEVARQTDADLQASDVFKREADSTLSDKPADALSADEVEG